MTTDLLSLFHRLEDELNSEVLERNPEIHTAVLALLGRKHHFQLGPPGTAKSATIDRLHKRIGGMDDNGYFRWLLTQYTVPEEIYGGPDFIRLRETGQYKRVTDRKLPKAYLVFLDEIFKANSSILNAGLTAMNEREFYNLDDDPAIPLISLYAASNELPVGENLWALWDRLHFRHVIKPMQDSSSYYRMLAHPWVPNPAPVLRLSDIHEAHKLVDAVLITDEIFDAMNTLRLDLKDQGVEATERRWVECLGVIRAEAFFNGREIADIEDMRPLMHVLWSEEEAIPKVKKTVLQLANPIDREASDLVDRLSELSNMLTETIEESDGNTKALKRGSVEVHEKMVDAQKRLKKLKVQQKASGRRSEYLVMANQKFTSLAIQLGENGFGIDPETVRKRLSVTNDPNPVV